MEYKVESKIVMNLALSLEPQTKKRDFFCEVPAFKGSKSSCGLFDFS